MTQCFLFSHSPYHSSFARESLDMALAFAAFDESVQMVFIGDGVYQLIKQQDSQHAGLKNIEKSLAALPMYDINALFVCQKSLSERGLALDNLSLDVTPLAPEAISALLHQADKVMSL